MMIKLVETVTHYGTTSRKRYYMDGKRVSEAEWMGKLKAILALAD